MQTNLPVWSYYPRDNSYFIDPMYVPYQNAKVETECGICDVNTWKKQGYANGLVNPALVRNNWGLDFQLLHPDKDPCPEGWTKGKDGWCVANKPEFGDHGLYSKDAFIAKYQYFGGYAPQPINPRYREINEFDPKSVNPFTGEYVVYHNPNPGKSRDKYGMLPSKDSFLA